MQRSRLLSKTRRGPTARRPWWKSKLTAVLAVVAAAVTASLTGVITDFLNRGIAAVSPRPPVTQPVAALAVDVTDTTRSDDSCGRFMSVNRPERVPVPAEDEDPLTWIRTFGMRPFGESTLRLTVMTTRSDAVVLQSMRVVVDSRGPAATANVFETGECGDAMDIRWFDVDLDRPRPEATALIPTPTPDDPSNPEEVEIAREAAAELQVAAAAHPMTFPLRVSPDDPEELVIIATSTANTVLWHLELEWTYRGQTQTTRLDNHGLLFRTVAASRQSPLYISPVDGNQCWRVHGTLGAPTHESGPCIPPRISEAQEPESHRGH